MTQKSSPPSNPEVVPSNGHVDRRLFDAEGAAVYLQSLGAAGASKKFIYNLMVNGELPRVRIGKKYFVSKSSIDSWLVRHERRAR